MFTGADIQAALYTAQLSSIHESTPSMEDLKNVEASGSQSLTQVESIVTLQHIIDACSAARPSVSMQDRRMYNKIYKKYLADRGQEEGSFAEHDVTGDDDVYEGYNVNRQRTALA